jgi:hypothetical protein
MRCLYHPSASFEIRVGFLFLDLFPALFYVRDVMMFFDNFLGWLARIAFVCAKVLHNIVGAVDHDFIEHYLKLGDIMSVCPCYDYRQRDTTAVHQDVTLAAFFFPCLLGCGQQLPGREEL